MAAALNTPVSIMDNADEGGPWGMAILAAYMRLRKEGERLEDYLKNRVFNQIKTNTVLPDAKAAAGFERFLRAYRAGLAIEKTAVTKSKSFSL